MSRARPAYRLDPSTGRPVMDDRAGRPVRPSPILLPGQMAIAPGPARPQPQAPPLEMLIPFLASQGAVPQLNIGWTAAGDVTFTCSCGPIQIPVAIDLGRMVAAVVPAIEKAMDEANAALEAAQQPGEPGIAPGTEDLLAEARANVESSRIILPFAPAEAVADTPA